MQMNHYANKKSLALLGQGRWKHALGCTLLLIGLLLSINCAFAQSFEGGKLQMSKTFKPTNEDQTEGLLWLETYVTGAHISNTVTPPADIVLVLDMSRSMSSENLGNITRVQALHNAVEDFLGVIKEKDIEGAGQNDVIGHRVSIVVFSSQAQTSLYSTNSAITYANVDDDDCRQSLREVTDSNGQINSYLTAAVNRINANNTVIGTYGQYGLDLAYRVLDTREITTYTDSDGHDHDRNVIVVFFTDGFPGGSGTQTNFRVARGSGYDTNNQANEADAAVYQANRIKGIKGEIEHKNAVIYSVGIFGNANPYASYHTTYTASNNNQYYGSYTSVAQAANGYMHMVSSDLEYVDNMPNYTYNNPWPNGTSNPPGNVGYFQQHTCDANAANAHLVTDPATGDTISIPKYFAASNQAGLKKIFTTIASSAASDPISMTSGTMIQDVISSSFTLQQGTSVNAIEVYAVKCTGATVDSDGNVTSCEFETPDADSLPDLINGGYYTHGTKTSYNGDQILYLPLITEGENQGAVDETQASGKENRLDPGNGTTGLVRISEDGDGNPQVNITGFNFTAMYCGLEGEDGGHPRGRKLVIKIPIKVKEGVWGDEFNTNGPMSFVLPEGDTIPYYFEKPIANVLGTVWTEKVTSMPTGFDPMNIDSPEDLAWFISCVNGRAHYEEGTNNVASNPGLSGKLTADIDMSAHNWVSIGAGYKTNNQGQYVDANNNPVYKYIDGQQVFDDHGKPVTVPTVKNAYRGTFDGNGHVITGLKNNAAKYYKLAYDDQYQVLVFPGMFSNVEGTVKNVYVLDADFRARNHANEKETFVHFGIIADTLSSGGKIFNCEAVGSITCNDDDNFERNSLMVLGGLVGYNDGGTIHSSMAMPTLTGYTMGGMIGKNEGSFTNGFTNPMFNYLYDETTGNMYANKPVGGIAGINANASNIKNCYVRFSRNSSKLDKAAFGQVVGSGGFTEASCYTPRSDSQEMALPGDHNTAWNNTIPVAGASENLYSVRRN